MHCQACATAWMLLLGLGCTNVFVTHLEAEQVQPNVLLILADDLALGDLSSVSQGRCRTPNLDRLRSQSMWFHQAYSASPVCAPARAALLTGRYPHRTGVVSLNMENYPQWTRLKRDEVTLADLFRQAGYRTALIGKWHLGIGPDFHPLQRGFDEFQGFIGHKYVPNYFNYRLDIQSETKRFRDRYLTDDLNQRAIDFIRRNHKKPFFLHLAHYAPHRPLGAPQDRIQPYLEAGFDEETATVYAMIEIMDEGIGKVLDELHRLEMDEKTIVVFASDNGPDPVVASRWNAGLRGTKYTVYEGGIRVPLMIRHPKTWEAGTSDVLVHFVDIVPTLMEMCHLRRESKLPLDGQSLIPVLESDSPTTVPRFWQWNRTAPIYSQNAALRVGDWKLVRPFVTRNVPKGEPPLPVQLFQVGQDPKEEINVAAKYPEKVHSLTNQLDAWSKSVEQDRTRQP